MALWKTRASSTVVPGSPGSCRHWYRVVPRESAPASVKGNHGRPQALNRRGKSHTSVLLLTEKPHLRTAQELTWDNSESGRPMSFEETSVDDTNRAGRAATPVGLRPPSVAALPAAPWRSDGLDQKGHTEYNKEGSASLRSDLSGILRIGCPHSVGLGVRNPSDWVSGFVGMRSLERGRSFVGPGFWRGPKTGYLRGPLRPPD